MKYEELLESVSGLAKQVSHMHDVDPMSGGCGRTFRKALRRITDP